MPKLHEVITGTRDTEVLLNGVPVQITYDPNAYTPEAEALWNNENINGTPGQLAISFLCELLKYWDLEEEDSEELIRIEPDRMAKISLVVLSGIMEGIFKDINDGDDKNPPNRAARRAAAKKPR